MVTAIIALLESANHLDIGWYVYILPVILDLVIIEKVEIGGRW